MIERCNYCETTHETNETKVGGLVFKECPEYPNDNTALGWNPNDWKPIKSEYMGNLGDMKLVD